MAMPQCAYKSQHPEVIAEWEESERRWSEYRAKVDDFAARYPDHQVVVRKSFGRSRMVIGLSDRGDEEQNPGEGWKLGKNFWVPDKRLRAGKLLLEELDALKVDGVGEFSSMPAYVTTPAQTGVLRYLFRYHSVYYVDGVVWVGWDVPAEKVEGGDDEMGGPTRFDPGKWQRVKLSDYFLAVEKEQDERDKE